MYRILGGDGKEYGPVATETLRQWVNEARANRNTPVRPEGSDQWQSLGSLPEFAPLFAPPPPGWNAAVGGVPIGPLPQSGFAVASLIMGILGFITILTGLLGIVFGWVALRKIKMSNGRLGGRGLAKAGILLSIVALPVATAGYILVVRAANASLAGARGKAHAIHCVNNLKQLGLAARLYAGDYDGQYPSGTNWCGDLLTYAGTAKIYQCPGDAAQLSCGYAFTSALADLAEQDIAPDTVMFFESDTGWNASGGKELMITQPRHNNTFVIGLADGSVLQVQAARLAQLRWNPTNRTNNVKE